MKIGDVFTQANENDKIVNEFELGYKEIPPNEINKQFMEEFYKFN